MQLEELNNASYSGPALHYMGIFLEDDSNMARSLESLVAGKLMSGWWDTCQQAGSQRRPRTSFSEPTPTLDVLIIGEDSKCRNLSSKSFSNIFLIPIFLNFQQLFVETLQQSCLEVFLCVAQAS